MMNKVIFLVVFVSILSFSCSHKGKNGIQGKNKVKEIELVWAGDSIGDLYIPNSRITMPFTLEGLTEQFYVEFYLDFEGTVLYDEVLRDVSFSNQDLRIKMDSVSAYRQADPMRGQIHGLNGKIGGMGFTNSSFILKKFQGNPGDSVIGRVGLDFFKNKYLIVDLQHPKVLVFDTCPGLMCYEECCFSDFAVNHGRVTVPLHIDDKSYNFWVCPQSKAYVFFSKKNLTRSKVFFANQQVGPPMTYPEKDSFIAYEKIDGILGAPFFSEQKIVIDLIHNKIALFSQPTEEMQ